MSLTFREVWFQGSGGWASAFLCRAVSDLLPAPVRELSFGHVSVEGFNVNLSESLGLTPWDPHACAEGMHLSGSFRSVDLTTTSSPQLVGASVSFWPQRTPVISQKSTNHISTRSDQVASPVLVCVLCPTLWRQEAPRHTSAIAGSCPCLQHLVSSLSIPSLQHAGFVIHPVPCAVQSFRNHSRFRTCRRSAKKTKRFKHR